MDLYEIKQARLSLGLTQAQLAMVMGYTSQSYISRLERGTGQIGPQGERLLQAYLDGYRPADWPID